MQTIPEATVVHTPPSFIETRMIFFAGFDEALIISFYTRRKKNNTPMLLILFFYPNVSDNRTTEAAHEAKTE